MIKVAIIEDNDYYRQALQHLLDTDDEVKVVYTASNCINVEDGIRNANPDVVIMDIAMPGINGVEGVRILRKAVPDIKIFMLTTFEDDEMIFDSIKAGAIGYLLKNDGPDEIIAAIHKVNNGESVMNGKVARKVLQYFSGKENTKNTQLDQYNLTAREKEILELLMQGLSYKEIAAQSFISLATVFSHIRKIYAKLDVHSRAEITNKFK